MAGRTGPTRRALALTGLTCLAELPARLAVSPSRAASAADTCQATQASRPRLNIDVMEFGARGDGQTDDSAAINAAFRHVRTTRLRTHGVDLGYRIVFPAGAYVAAASLDLTGIRDVNTVIDGQGSVIIGCCQGAVIDALGSRWLTMRDLTILGDRRQIPSVGLQIGVASPAAVADDHVFDNVKILGRFSVSCLYNRGAETSAFTHLMLWNDQPGGYCLVQDGMNHFGMTSVFTAGGLARHGALSFNENVFVNCDFRHGGGGTPVWLGDTTRHAFIRCYSATSHGPSFLVKCGLNSHTMLDIDCHCETAGLQDVFCFSSAAPRATLRGFSYRDHASNAERFVFTADRPMDVAIENATIEVASYRSEACRVFDGHVGFAVTGSYYSSTAAAWNGARQFRGRLAFGQRLGDAGDAEVNAGFGTSVQRPDERDVLMPGHLYFDRTIAKLLVWSGAGWVDAHGVPQ